MAAEERLTLVTDFGKLKAGDLVVVKPCGHCGASHRGMLVGFEADAAGFLPSGEAVVGPQYQMAPAAVHRSGRTASIAPETVARRVVYLVDTGLEQTETTATTKSRPLARIE